MARINLLPWRQEERLRRNKEFNAMAAAGAVVAALITLLVMAYLGNELSNQQEANKKIETENQRLDKVNEEIKDLEAKRDEMVSRMKVIQDLQGRRSVPVRVWDDIARAVPANMYLVSIKREGDTLTINGFADNNNVVSQLVRKLDESPWLSGSRIPQIKTKLQAYENTLANAGNKNASGKEAERGILPEDNYVEFTVTTTIKPDEPNTTNVNGANPEVMANAEIPTNPAPESVEVTAPPATQTPAPVQDMQNKAGNVVAAANNETQAANTDAGSADPKPVIADTTGGPITPTSNTPPSDTAKNPQATNSAGGQ